MRLMETIRKDYDKQRRVCEQEQAKLARLENEYFAAIDAIHPPLWQGLGGLS